MIEDREQQQIRKRLEWALHDNKATIDKSLRLLSELGPLSEEQRALWVEITEHMANVESHLQNAFPRVPELPTKEITMTHKMGWKPDLPDKRDHLYHAPKIVLPPSVDLRPTCPPIQDQGQLGSCTAFAITGALGYDQIKQGETFTPLSELFVYYNERAKEHTIASDAGASIRDGIYSVSHQGACPELEWPYNISQFTVKPSHKCYEDARSHRALSYQRLNQALSQLKSCLASGYPFVFGFTVYTSFESGVVARTGIVPMPELDESVLGGHAVVAVGYDDAKQWFIVRNSWGASFGDKGYVYMPYAYLTDRGLSSDFWTIRTVS